MRGIASEATTNRPLEDNDYLELITAWSMYPGHGEKPDFFLIFSNLCSLISRVKWILYSLPNTNTGRWMSPLILPTIEINASMLQSQRTSPLEIVEVLGPKWW